MWVPRWVREFLGGQGTHKGCPYGKCLRRHAQLKEEHKVLERGTSIARVIVACVMLTLVAGLAACSPDLTPTPITIISPTPAPTPFPTVRIELLRLNALVGTRAIDLAAPLRTVVDEPINAGQRVCRHRRAVPANDIAVVVIVRRFYEHDAEMFTCAVRCSRMPER